MTLTAVEAEEIVDECIRSAVGWDGLISGGNKLSDVGVVDDDAVDALIDEIVTNTSVGVQSKGHRIDPESLDLATQTTVSQTQVQVIENAVVAPAAAKAATAAKKLGMAVGGKRATPAEGRKSDAKKEGGKRSTASKSRKQTGGKKAAKKGTTGKATERRGGGKKGAKKEATGSAKRARKASKGGRRGR